MEKGFIIWGGEFNATTGLTSLWNWSILFYSLFLSTIFLPLWGGMEGIAMTILKKLKDYLEKNQVRYEVGVHEMLYTAQEIAATMHIPGKEWAKVVMVKADGKMTMLVLPASYRVDTKKVKKVLKCKRLGISKEKDFEELFPDCEVGAMPPFGNLYNLEVWVDQALTEDEFIVFQAGSHVETLKIKYSDYAQLVNPKVGDFSLHL
jgi:Ala-tRNA(Pro) deacylase